MQADFATLLAELREDHRNMSILLTVIENETDAVAGGGDADFEMLGDIMMYMTAYADAVHHPKEDIIYAQMLETTPEWAAERQQVADDHERIARLGIGLRDAIEAVVAGAAVTREQVVNDLRAYSEGLRGHMAWEERDLFLRAEAMDADSGITFTDKALEGSDPLFGASPRQRFEPLLRRLQAQVSGSLAG